MTLIRVYVVSVTVLVVMKVAIVLVGMVVLVGEVVVVVLWLCGRSGSYMIRVVGLVVVGGFMMLVGCWWGLRYR